MNGGGDTAVLVLDLDGFRMFNDSFGHEAGDEVLAAAVGRLQAVGPQGSTVTRIGSDEFAVVCDALDGANEAVVLARRLIAALRSTPFDVHDHQVFLGAHVGIAVSAAEGEDRSLVDLMRDAETAMSRAKEDRAPWAVYTPEMREASRRFLATASDLRHAVTGRQLRVEFQPIVTLPAAVPFALEALARWDHPTRGRVHPDDFINVAEKAGLIAEIGEWVLHQAAAAAVRWRRIAGRGAPKVSVNVSAQQLGDPDFIYTVTRCLEQWQLPFEQLVLEVTESAVMENFDLANETLRVLSGLGVQVAIDDFGAGASSLSQLKKLRWVDMLKIDKSFVDGLGEDDEVCSIVSTIIALARALNMSVVAEGVETETQAAQLVASGCHHAQGFHFGRPLRPRATDALVKTARGAAV
jgi:diguanylate cyclase (GGDEF)-like protein